MTGGGSTNTTGYTAVEVPRGNYTVHASKTGYNPGNVSGTYNIPQIITVALTIGGEAMSMELMVLGGFTLFFGFITLRGESIPAGLLASIFSLGTGVYWLSSRTSLNAAGLLFVLLGLVFLAVTLMKWGSMRKDEPEVDFWPQAR